MSKKKKFTVDDAYALNTPADSVRLYGQWADTYDTEFVASSGYELFLRVAEQFLEHKSSIQGPVLDVGCGTGLVGACLRAGGIEVIDGIDISGSMLAEAGRKKTRNDTPVYRNLIEADLTATLDIPDNTYGGLLSAGTFTHGHLGPESLDELWRVAALGAICAVSINATHYSSKGFGDKLSADVSRGKITEPKLLEVNVYSGKASKNEHASDRALIAVCEVAE